MGSPYLDPMKKTARTVWRRLFGTYRASHKAMPKPKRQRSNRKKATVLLPTRPVAVPSRYLAVMAAVKNEEAYLREWIEFQRLMGADQIYLYDNGSTDDSAAVLAPYVAEGFVTVIPWVTFDEEVSPQRQAYAHALCNFGPHFRWMAFIDLDEFLFPVTAPNLAAVLRRYEDCPCVCVPWFMFGFSGHETPAPGLIIESYTRRAPFPPPATREKLLKWKSIVQPSAVIAVSGAHMFDLVGGITGGVDERKAAVEPEGTPPPPGNVLRVNHYYTRSRQEFTAKVNSIRFTTSAQNHRSHSDPRNRQRLMEMIEAETVHDDTILRFLPELRERMNLGKTSTRRRAPQQNSVKGVTL